MIVLKSLFRDKENFKRRINSSKLDFNKTCLIRLYSSVLSKEQIRTVAKQIKDIIPISTIIGGSCCGVVYEGEHYETETLVIIEQFDYTEILAKSYDTTSLNVHDLVKTINEELVTDDTRLLHVLFGNHYVDINQFVDNFNSINSNVSLMGGATGEILSKNLQPYVVFDDKVLDDYVVVASISSKDLEVFTSVNTSVEPITSVYNIDKCDGENILNIEGMPALDWCKDIFDFSICQEEGFNNDILTLFPLVLEKDNSSDITRFIRYDENTEDISLYCSKLEDNIKFRIGYINPFKCVQRIYDICKQLEVKKLDNLFFYSCLFRKSFLGSCSKWEISPFKKQICGVFMMGEICSINNKNQFLNGSCCILGIGENSQNRIKVDLNVFEDLYKIKDENERILNKVLKKYSNSLSKQNKDMLEKVIARQSKAENELYFNSNLQMYNSIKFSHDKTLRKFNKICLLQLSNIELILSKLEKEEYYSKFRSIVKTIINFIQNYEDYNVEYKIYSISDNTIFLALKDNNSNVGEFLNFVNRLYENFQFVRLEDNNEIFVFRFAVVEDEYNLLECGLQTLQKCKELQTYFLVYDREEAMKSDFNHEMEVINILNDAIKNDRVEPYFQGIFDNENKTINKYEALIRIKDADGNIYAPGYFMDIAKKYNIYLNLSKIMINKVFERFRYSDISVSINLSAYDINSKLIQNVIFENLRHCTNNNIIFELLEDECFRDIDMLNDFVAKAKKYNVKIAIDDFGVGYSNFMKIAKISPDFIKIDGSIIKNIDKYEINRKVLKSIVFLGNQLDAELVAEFVENQDVQDILDDLQVHFSQGYFFAKPLCYEDIKSNI